MIYDLPLYLYNNVREKCKKTRNKLMRSSFPSRVAVLKHKRTFSMLFIPSIFCYYIISSKHLCPQLKADSVEFRSLSFGLYL